MNCIVYKGIVSGSMDGKVSILCSLYKGVVSGNKDGEVSI